MFLFSGEWGTFSPLSSTSFWIINNPETDGCLETMPLWDSSERLQWDRSWSQKHQAARICILKSSPHHIWSHRLSISGPWYVDFNAFMPFVLALNYTKVHCIWVSRHNQYKNNYNKYIPYLKTLKKYHPGICNLTGPFFSGNANKHSLKSKLIPNQCGFIHCFHDVSEFLKLM